MKNKNFKLYLFLSIFILLIFIPNGYAKGISLDSIERDGYFEGYLKEDMGNNRIKVESYGGEEIVLRLSPGIIYEIDGSKTKGNKRGENKYINLEDYSSNQEVYMTILNGSVNYMDGVDKLKNDENIYKKDIIKGTYRRVRHGRLEFDDESGNRIKLPLSRETKYQVDNKSQQESSLSDLKPGMKLDIQMDGRRARIVTGTSNPGTSNYYLEGVHRGYKSGRLNIKENNGRDSSYPLESGAKITVDGRSVKIEELKQGMYLYTTLRNGKIREIETFSSIEPGYIEPNSIYRTGVITGIDKNQLEVRFDDGKEKSMFISPATVILRNGINIKSNSLYVGDNIKIYLDELESKNINKLLVEGKSVEIKEILRGKLMNVDQMMENLYLDDLHILRNQDWQSYSSGERFSYDRDLNVYIGGSKVNNRNLKDYKGRTSYVAIKEELGKDKIEQMTIKSDYERNFSTKITDVNKLTSQLELKDGQNISINEGTIVIKSGRLVDINSINPNSDAFIVADGVGGQLQASIVNIYNEDLNNSNIGREQLYAGRVDRIFEDKISLREYFLLEENQWVSFGGDKNLFYDKDTIIYDMKDKKKINPNNFFGSKYSVDEDNNREKNRDWYAYVYTDGDRISNIFLTPKMDSLLRQRVTTGTISKPVYEDEFIGSAIQIRDAKDWSLGEDRWIGKNATLNLYLKDAMIIREGKMMDERNLKAGDRLYITRDENMGKIIIVK